MQIMRYLLELERIQMQFTKSKQGVEKAPQGAGTTSWLNKSFFNNGLVESRKEGKKAPDKQLRETTTVQRIPWAAFKGYHS